MRQKRRSPQRQKTQRENSSLLLLLRLLRCRRRCRDHRLKIKKEKNTLPYLICSLSAASQSEVKPVRASETTAASASLDTLASSGLTCAREREEEEKERETTREASVHFSFKGD